MVAITEISMKLTEFHRFRWTQMQLEDFLSSSSSRPRLRTQKEINDKLNKLREHTGVTDLDIEYDRIYHQNTLSGLES